ncbi:MAG: roadblock/LC7 domain-containing protein [Gemmatimonadota bacterium]|nr:MAG: roadblock/LC7 domain-containing protein [Gemmatimonadota bacterium]
MSRVRAVEPWIEDPLVRFVTEAGARLTLIMTPSGQVLAQHGFTRAVDVMAAAALGAAIVSSTREIATTIGEETFRALNHQGIQHGIFLAEMATPRGPLLALVVYGPESSVGLVQLFYEDLVQELVAACPDEEPTKPVIAADFERDLHNSLAFLFGR